jgi:hypothetical protein
MNKDANLESLDVVQLAAAVILPNALAVCLVLADLRDDGVVVEKHNVLGVIVGLVLLLDGGGGHAGVDAFEDAQLAEILERQLQLEHGTVAVHQVGHHARLALLALFPTRHAGSLLLAQAELFTKREDGARTDVPQRHERRTPACAATRTSCSRQTLGGC